MSEIAAKQASFEGWAIVEIMGHQRHIGFVTAEAFGPAVLFRVDTPELPERDFVLTAPEYAGHSFFPKGSKVRRPKSEPVTVFVGPSTIYRLTPCTEEAARQAIESLQSRPLMLLEMPEGKQITAAAEAETCELCGFNIDDCECDGEPDDRISDSPSLWDDPAPVVERSGQDSTANPQEVL